MRISVSDVVYNVPDIATLENICRSDTTVYLNTFIQYSIIQYPARVRDLKQFDLQYPIAWVSLRHQIAGGDCLEGIPLHRSASEVKLRSSRLAIKRQGLYYLPDYLFW